ncbi:MAG: methyl-accepting chemotaxis protein [Defluviitaleaceae bacterium]|nr:methyl-accepting chemotaxis protein [Defluviitaleaceae bacterium]
MRSLITNQLENCVGCNRCVRVCPIAEANVTSIRDGKILVEADNSQCIACGACLTACHHGSRHYEDDTERFFDDLSRGVQISMFVAPAVRTNFPDWERMMTWLRRMGVKTIYDVSLGADICTWAHIRHIQKNPGPIMSQPCPAIVSYILMHKHELIPYLSPIHSPMLCTAIFMQKYEGINNKIAALSPCVAKAHEFEETGYVEYNVTFKNLSDYIKARHVHFPDEKSGFDSYDSGLGTLYPMPGGLKENVEHYVGKTLRIDKSEGISRVFKDIDEYAKTHDRFKPGLFDVLNCEEGCNVGTACGGHGHHHMDIFEISYKMNKTRQAVLGRDKWKYLDELFEKFDKTLRHSDFIRKYNKKTVPQFSATRADVENVFKLLNKHDEAAKTIDCGACGCDTCYEMAEGVAKGLDIPESCLKKAYEDVKVDNENNIRYYDTLLADMTSIKGTTAEIVEKFEDVMSVIATYNQMVDNVDNIAKSINLISINASIEAARAGKYGRAFSIVAAEVRKLARTSEESANETRSASSGVSSITSNISQLVSEINENVNETFVNISTISENTKHALDFIFKEDDDEGSM